MQISGKKTLNRQLGLSLIELMIAILLASILLLGVLQIFDGNRQTSRLQDAISRIQESGRMASDLLSRELRGTAFTGCLAFIGAPQNHVGTMFDGNKIDGQDNVPDGIVIGGKTVTKDTDVLTLQGAEDACGGQGRVSSTVNTTQLQLEGSCAGVQTGEYVLVSSCSAGDITTVVSIAGDPPILTVNNNLSTNYGVQAHIYRPYVREYFVSTDTVTGNPGLFISENGATAVEFMPGVEDLQVVFGRDSGGGDDIVDVWGGPPSSADEAEEIVAVRFQLLIAADENVGAEPFAYIPLGTTTEVSAPDDGNLRKTYSALTKLRNRGSR